MVHMRVEHQRRAPAGSFQRADDIRPAVFNVLILDLHAELLELAAKISCHALFLARDADDIGQVAGQFDDSIAIHLIQDLFTHVFLLILRSPFKLFSDPLP